MHNILGNPRSTLIVLACWACSASASWANVNLEWRQEPGTVHVGDTVRIGLYAVSDDETQQPVTGMQVIFSWDPAFLQLLGLDDNGPYVWGASSFPPDPYGLNETIPPQDGDGIYTNWANLQGPAMAPPWGLLVTTFEFTAVAATPGTVLSMEESGGSPLTYSTVYGPDGDVTGTLEAITIVVEDSCICGDIDGSGGPVDLTDFATFALCFGFTGPAMDCDAAEFFCSDLSGDGIVDLLDFCTLALWFGLESTQTVPNCTPE